MEFYEQYASYPFEEWLSQRKSHPSWEALLPTEQMMMMNMDYELLSSTHPGFSNYVDSALEENPLGDNYFLSSCCEGFSSSPSLDQELNYSAGSYCPIGRDQFQAQAVMDNSSYSTYETPRSNLPVQEDNYAILSLMDEDVFGDDFEAPMDILGA
ncbi:hypothetical protein CRG98_027932, partial [Punica granatum]